METEENTDRVFNAPQIFRTEKLKEEIVPFLFIEKTNFDRTTYLSYFQKCLRIIQGTLELSRILQLKMTRN